MVTTNDEASPRFAFPIQQGETIIQVCRRHWIHLWPRIGLQVLLAIVPLVGVAILASAVDVNGIAETILWILAGVHAVYRVLMAFLLWYRYHHDIWVITNQRIIDSYKAHPFNIRIATTDLVNVQDMYIERHGVLQTMLNYGDIVCQTASEVQAFRLPGIPDPMTVQALVDKERDRERLKL